MELLRHSCKIAENAIVHYDTQNGNILGTSIIEDKHTFHFTWGESPSPLGYSNIIEGNKIGHFDMDKNQLGYSIILENKKVAQHYNMDDEIIGISVAIATFPLSLEDKIFYDTPKIPFFGL
jgi:hypothetical protein